MHLAPTDEQQAIQQEARRFLGAEITRERRLAWDQTPEGHDAGVLAGRRPARLVRLRAARDGGRAGRVAARPRAADRGVRPRRGAVRHLRGHRRRARARRARHDGAATRDGCPRVARGEKLVTLAVAEAAAALDPAAFATDVDAARAAAPARRREALRAAGRDGRRVPGRGARRPRRVGRCWCPPTPPGVTVEPVDDVRARIGRAPSGCAASTLPATALVGRAGDRVAAARAAARASSRRCSAPT